MFKSIATAVLAVSFAGAAMADDNFKASEFLNWSNEGKTGYVNSSVAMAQAMVNPTQAKCIGDWAKQNASTGYAELFKTMEKYSDYHPTGIIAVILEKNCGQFTLAKH